MSNQPVPLIVPLGVSINNISCHYAMHTGYGIKIFNEHSSISLTNIEFQILQRLQSEFTYPTEFVDDVMERIEGAC